MKSNILSIVLAFSFACVAPQAEAGLLDKVNKFGADVKDFGNKVITKVETKVDPNKVQLTSGSKYDIVVTVYPGDSHCTNEIKSGLEKAIGGLTKFSVGVKKWAKGNNSSSQEKDTLRDAALAVTGGSCGAIGGEQILRQGQRISIPKGSHVLAYKDPFAAWSNHKKLVSAVPTTFEATQDTTLYTQKILGVGDRGLGNKPTK